MLNKPWQLLKKMRRQLKQAFFFFQKVISTILYPFYIVFNYFSPQLKIPVIMYHMVCDISSQSAKIRYDNVSPEQFEQQMQYLNKGGYQVASLDEYLKWQKGELNLPKKSVVITFDDGYKNVYDNAYPVLKKYTFSAAIFLVTDYIGKKQSFGWFKVEDNSLIPLSWGEVKEMNQSNITIGSHTMSHPHLGKLPAEKVVEELKGSKQEIENQLNKKVSFFSYPIGIKQYGIYNNSTKRELISSGYQLAFVSEIGRNKRGSDCYIQKRIAIAERDSLFDFKCKLVGAYDWVGLAQTMFQKIFKEIN